MTPGAEVLADFSRGEFTDNGVTHHYYRRGTGPAVIVIPEIPGVTPKVAAFARRVSDAGCTVFVPSLFGIDGADPVPDGLTDLPRVGALMARSLGRVCVSREFTIFATGKSSPVVHWLRALARHAHAECGGPGVGAIGMCVTGGFALAMAVDPVLLAPVLSQPSLPFGISPGRRRNIDIAPDDLAAVQARCARGLQVMGARFEGDMMVPGSRFDFLREHLGEAFIGVELPDDAAAPDALLPPHSVVTEHLIDSPGEPTHDTLEEIIDFFRRKLAV
ncbi:dienelactone hydrolase family protein [Gordonia sp. (in: high G+C Gram-positive bacteria)]|uniref:dienelactone hydrolase family protein n=1 Tax=Gordonia sp. (in: high G+C Gram-positive bacteria) TaxID=84139 RepID=UPI0016B07123|nr:dienelactone hydrolase family protein [Gordonia sp. (in: high G+C Gram-positive bacteria)]NLG45876.1 dienelactone hydrolase [Gordonia sp. (in: high G+C Gram-positive bacteria)]